MPEINSPVYLILYWADWCVNRSLVLMALVGLVLHYRQRMPLHRGKREQISHHGEEEVIELVSVFVFRISDFLLGISRRARYLAGRIASGFFVRGPLSSEGIMASNITTPRMKQAWFTALMKVVTSLPFANWLLLTISESLL